MNSFSTKTTLVSVTVNISFFEVEKSFNSHSQKMCSIATMSFFTEQKAHLYGSNFLILSKKESVVNILFNIQN